VKLCPIVDAGVTLGYAFWCPGCDEIHQFFTVARRPGGPVWEFNGDLERPTFSPSLAYRGERLCHVFVRDGKIQFLADCWHELRNQTVEIPEWPYGNEAA
jgi:hypothetical protein